MKKFLVFIFTLNVFISFAQEDTQSKNKSEKDSIDIIISELKKKGVEHFKFKEIPIDGPLTNFVNQLKKENFQVIEITEKDAILKGDFAGEKVHLLVQGTSKIVYGVTVMFDKQNTWKSLKKQYDNIKDILKAKYGEPKECIEKFDDPFYEKAGMELDALDEEKCTFMTLFATESGNGMINLKLSPDATVVINYIDSINFFQISNEARKDY